MENIREQLARSSAIFARSAIAAIPTGESATFTLHAATAVEHALKAALAKRHPALIAASDFNSLLLACGEPGVAPAPAGAGMRTITASESLDRMAKLNPSVRTHESAIRTLLHARNAVAHAGAPTPTDSLRAPFIVAVELVRDEIGLSRDEYWKDFAPMVSAALQSEMKDARIRVEAALGAARQAFDQRYGELDEHTRQAVIRAIELSMVPTQYEEDTHSCPACDREALARGFTETEWEVEGDPDDAYFRGTFFAGGLNCRVCGLELDGDDELEAAGVDTSWELDDVDPGDFYEPFEDY